MEIKQIDGIEVPEMTEQEFADTITKIIYPQARRARIDTTKRPLYAALSFAYHGRADTVSIQAQGSPPRMSVIVERLSDADHCREVYINRRRLLPHRKKHTAVCNLVDLFLRSPAFVNCLARNDKAYREHLNISDHLRAQQ